MILQVVTALFAIALAWANEWPVKLMRDYWADGSHTKQERSFHAANAAVKALWGLTLAYACYGLSVTALWFAAILGLILWFVFDIALNLFTGQKWDYLGQTAWLDKVVKNGRVKAVVVIVLIAALNYVLRLV